MGTRKPSFALNHIAAPGLDLATFFDLATSLGLHDVEIRNDIEGRPTLDGTAPEVVKGLAKTAGVEILTINALQRFNDWNGTRAKEAEALADYAQKCGARMLVLVPVNDLKELAPILTAHGLIGLVEPLGFEICSLRSKKEAIDAIQALNYSDRFKVVHDTFHHFLAGEADLFPQQTGMVHISGVTDTNIGASAMLDPHRVLVDEADRLGNIAQLSALLAGGYEGHFSFEPFAASVQNDPHLRSSLEASMHFINRHLLAE